jgi:uncharacterized OB-fold protein
MLENLDHIKTRDFKSLLKKRILNRKCHNCGELRCVHRDIVLKLREKIINFN